MSKFTKPTGDRRDEMVASPAWPEIDEDDLLHRHNEYERLRTQLVSVKDTWDGYKSGLFNPNAWFGGAATSAQGKVDGHVTSMKQLDSQLKAASGFYLKAYRAVYEAKDRITKATDKTQDDVGLLDSAKDAKKIEKMVNETFLSNADRVDQAVHQVSSFGSSDGSNPQNPEALPRCV